MDSAGQVAFVLQIILALGPLAVYFLGLGLVNSQAHPCLVNARVDFVLLATAFVPVIIGPVVVLVEHGHAWIALAVALAVAALFWVMLPARRGSWVVYNISAAQCRQVIEAACRRLGWATRLVDDQFIVAPFNLVIAQSYLPWLRNATLQIRSADTSPAADQFISALGQELARESMLPSPAGASLVVIGAALLGVPMWYLLNNIHAIVDVVKQILFA